MQDSVEPPLCATTLSRSHRAASPKSSRSRAVYASGRASRGVEGEDIASSASIRTCVQQQPRRAAMNVHYTDFRTPGSRHQGPLRCLSLPPRVLREPQRRQPVPTRSERSQLDPSRPTCNSVHLRDRLSSRPSLPPPSTMLPSPLIALRARNWGAATSSTERGTPWSSAGKAG